MSVACISHDVQHYLSYLLLEFIDKLSRIVFVSLNVA